MTEFSRLLGRAPKGLLFDLDGTLVDSVPDLAVAVDAMLVAAQLPLAGEERVRAWVGNGARKLVLRALAFARQCPEEHFNGEAFDRHYQQFLLAYRQSGTQHSRLYPGVLTALDYWQQQGIKMALVTNKPAEFIELILKQFQIDRFFSVLIGGDSLPSCKPNPEVLLYACQQLSLSVSECIMVGDSVNDVAAARAAGMAVACVSYGYNHGEPIKRSNPDLVVDHFDQLTA